MKRILFLLFFAYMSIGCSDYLNAKHSNKSFIYTFAEHDNGTTKFIYMAKLGLNSELEYVEFAIDQNDDVTQSGACGRYEFGFDNNTQTQFIQVTTGATLSDIDVQQDMSFTADSSISSDFKPLSGNTVTFVRTKTAEAMEILSSLSYSALCN